MAEDPKQTLKELEESLGAIKSAQQDIVSEFKESLVFTLQRSIIETDKLVDRFKKGKDISKELYRAYSDTTRTQITLSNKSIDLEKQLQKALKATNTEKNVQKQKDLINQLSSIKLQQKLNEDVLREIELLEKANTERKKQNSLSESVKNTLNETLGSQLTSISQMLTLSGIMALIVKFALSANKQSVELGKALGYGVDRADAFRENIANIARNSSNLNVNTANLVESFTELAKITGFVYEFSADQLTTQTKLTKQIGLSAEEAAQIQRFGVLNSKSSEDTYKSFVRGLTVQRNQSKIGIDFKATLAEAAKVSGQLAANLGYNPERIARAVVQAKAFGLTLEQTKKSSEALLDFGSSIENELKAELLTGKQINLERARAAALSGDQAALAEELAANFGSAEEFAKMNVLQQKSLAESLGLSVDELSESLRKREEAIASGKSLAQITEEETQQALERQNIQDKFNAAVLKLQDFFGNLVGGPLGTFLDMLSQSLEAVNLIVAPFKAIYDFTSLIGNSIGSWLNSLGVVGKILKGIASVAIIYAAYQTYGAVAAGLASTGIGGLLAPIVAGAAAAAVTSAGFGLLNSQKADDMVSEGGYGKRTLLSPEGAIKLNDKDTIIAGTNLGGGNNQTITPSIDLTPMISAINEVKASVDRLYSKDTSINMDGKRVGTTLTQGSYKVA